MNQYGQKLTVTVLCSFVLKSKSLGNFVNARGKREITTDEREATRTLPPPQALNNKANMIFDAHTVDIEISAGEENY